MKKTVAVILMLCLALAAIAGCAAKQEGYKVLDDKLAAEEYGIGFRNGDVALGMAVQDTLDAMIDDGKAAEISKTWFGKDSLIKTDKYYESTEIAADDSSLDKVKAAGKLIVGLDASFPPMGYYDEKNNIVGFDIDLAREVCSRMGVELVLQPINWDFKESELADGKIDCIWNGMTVTDERIESMFIAKPYIANAQVAIVPEGSDIVAIASLAGKTVGLQKGSSALEAVESSAIYDQIKDIVQYEDNVSCYLDLKAGRIDAMVVDEVVGRYLIESK